MLVMNEHIVSADEHRLLYMYNIEKSPNFADLFIIYHSLTLKNVNERTHLKINLKNWYVLTFFKI